MFRHFRNLRSARKSLHLVEEITFEMTFTSRFIISSDRSSLTISGAVKNLLLMGTFVKFHCVILYDYIIPTL